MLAGYRAPLAGCALLAGLAALPAAGQQAPQQQHQGMQHGGDGGGMMTGGAHGGAMQSAMQRMQQDMAVPMTGDPDVDFARMMIPHHQGAIDMARSQLESGKDPELRRLAERIVADQEREIAILQGWLDKHPK